MRSPGAGAYDFANASDACDPNTALWTAQALPSVIALTTHPPDLADPKFRLPHFSLEAGPATDAYDYLLERRGALLHVHLDDARGDIEPPAFLLPCDQLFEVRAQAAIRLWRGLSGHNPGPNPAALSPARRDRLILALRALDGRLMGATHREIAIVLFDLDDVSERDWISHDHRDRTARLVRLGFAMMNGGYRRLLLHPCRRRS